MTSKEAKSCIKTIEMLRRLAYNIHGVMDVIDADNCENIIKALEQEPCDDAISRQYLLDNCIVDKVTMPYVPVNKIKEALPINPQPKTGHWNEVFNDIEGEVRFYCSECNDYQMFTSRYCPNCGAKMIESQESEDKE